MFSCVVQFIPAQFLSGSPATWLLLQQKWQTPRPASNSRMSPPTLLATMINKKQLLRLPESYPSALETICQTVTSPLRMPEIKCQLSADRSKTNTSSWSCSEDMTDTYLEDTSKKTRLSAAEKMSTPSILALRQQGVPQSLVKQVKYWEYVESQGFLLQNFRVRSLQVVQIVSLNGLNMVQMSPSELSENDLSTDGPDRSQSSSLIGATVLADIAASYVSSRETAKIVISSQLLKVVEKVDTTVQVAESYIHKELVPLISSYPPVIYLSPDQINLMQSKLATPPNGWGWSLNTVQLSGSSTRVDPSIQRMNILLSVGCRLMWTTQSGKLSVLRLDPSAIDHILAVLSLEPVTNLVPSLQKLTEVIISEWASPIAYVWIWVIQNAQLAVTSSQPMIEYFVLLILLVDQYQYMRQSTIASSLLSLARLQYYRLAR